MELEGILHAMTIGRYLSEPPIPFSLRVRQLGPVAREALVRMRPAKLRFRVRYRAYGANGEIQLSQPI